MRMGWAMRAPYVLRESRDCLCPACRYCCEETEFPELGPSDLWKKRAARLTRWPQPVEL